MSFKPLFSRSLSLAPDRLHFAAHSHHLWPDASFEAHQAAWDEANRHADRKWDQIFGEVVPQAQAHVAAELGLSDPNTVVFASSTHDLLVRLVSGIERRPVRILATDGEFHSFRRQAARWEEAGAVVVERVALDPFDTFAERFVQAARAGAHDLILVSQVFFRTGGVFDRIADLAELARPGGPWVVVDGYHGFMALPTDLSAVQDRVFYLSGGYKYAMSGEGVCFLHAPAGYCPRPVVTGWFAEFGDLAGPPGGVGYRTDGGRFWGATFDFTALYRFNAVRRTLDEAGLDTAAVAAHARSLAERFQAAVTEGRAGRLVEAEVLNPVQAQAPRARFLALRHPDAAAWRAALLEAGVVTDVRDDVIRFGFGLYQDDADLDALIQRCASVLNG
ncbi:aminotransferase class V-fold PLP-dependent enzyme [Brevundimonas sp. S30B]|uniref:aminotransferase class V-fold PLP-dependent enzyme n=1 Tax=unclassified Brevundimonas TaxID=2622653 RepID=UPI0010716439|nr:MULTISPECIES: aminotransferase class V-fold PLP-dependent enzyme [unclassified Brevundimonas]QBX36718.1 aminotransferase class V-fold PLP-dependent enzyme [Brevundimonas sp. MF30-B]TFW04487.1 aminotransferase class V-fold PLP-dependent enzyme [Brevundimonas sp. S30B]